MALFDASLRKEKSVQRDTLMCPPPHLEGCFGGQLDHSSLIPPVGYNVASTCFVYSLTCHQSFPLCWVPQGPCRVCGPPSLASVFRLSLSARASLLVCRFALVLPTFRKKSSLTKSTLVAHVLLPFMVKLFKGVVCSFFCLFLSSIHSLNHSVRLHFSLPDRNHSC